MGSSSEIRKYKMWEPLLLAICVLLGLIAGANLVSHPPGEGKAGMQSIRHDHGRELSEIVRFIEEKYVDDVDSDVLVSSAITALLKDLDPHSGYLSPAEVRDLNEKMEGRFEGIGIEFQRVLDTAVVLHMMPGGPADKSGLRVYDRIVTANDSAMTSPELTEMDMVQFLRGEKSSVVNLEISRRGVDTLIGISMERDVIPIQSVETAYMIDKGVGYVRITSFSARTYKEFMDHLERLTQKEGMKDLILDLRHNPGGYLKEAVNILSQLFEQKGLLLVYTEGEHAVRTEYNTTGKPFYPVGNIVVLVDDGSASASEIVAGAIQDHDRGIVIGTNTYGKGMVQEQYALSNGGALRLTIARYYTPSGRLIQRPYENGAAIADNGQNVGDTIVYQTDNGRPVNGSGGINPDIFVEHTYDWSDKRFGQMYLRVLEYALYGYEEKQDYASWEDLMERFPPEEEITAGLTAFHAQLGMEVSFDSSQFGGLETYARQLLMSMIATDRFGYGAWHKVMNAEDPVVQKALEVIRDDRRITLKYE